MLLKILILYALSINMLYANIFRCEQADGKLLFKQVPCHADDIQSQITYIEPPISTQEARTLQKQLKAYRIVLQKEQQKKDLLQRRAAQQQQREEKRRLRLAARCETVERQITELRRQYRLGYTVKQGQALDRKMAEYKFKQQKYCKK